jgi:hypothetical protein
MIREVPLRRIARLLLVACVTAHIWCLVFRMVVYARLPLARGEPYGIADPLEWVFGATALALAGCCVGLGIFFMARRALALFRLGLVLAAVGGLTPLIVNWLHAYAARLGTR